ncbi:predicted protein [Streptomyces iranensis]|uniref:Uncharacterized protein n=1 Tax=Streptomyces iranensis TaxID=576784 RepID=A0A061A631_9ACTN|nr:hypothetical protein [Streptomyces iranensis]CDR17819.1 predicted protein [Streptomyces iranensis]
MSRNWRVTGPAVGVAVIPLHVDHKQDGTPHDQPPGP